VEEVDLAGLPNDETRTMPVEELRGFRALMPAGALLLAAPVQDCLAMIHASERRLVDKAVERRQREFSTGRKLAAAALRELGIAASPVLQGSMHEPLWPDGVVGSITHTGDTCMVAVCADGSLQGLGIDLEARAGEFDDLRRLILRPDENEHPGMQPLSANDRVRLAFSAKEAIYKAVFARAGRFVDFLEVCIDVDHGDQRFTARAPDDEQLHEIVCRGSGRYRITGDLAFSVWAYN
jgi:4'-phosphopantetheinyl transferase EntD